MSTTCNMFPFGVTSLLLMLLLSVHSVVGGDETAEDDLSDAGWQAFKERYGKDYQNSTEDDLRRAIRELNIQTIVKHNEEASHGLHNFTLGENEFVDWTPAERRRLIGYRQSPSTTTTSSRRRRQKNRPSMPIYSNTVDVMTLPDSINWTESGWVGPVMNQGECASSWAYASSGAIAAQYMNKTKTLVELSAQNLIDCSYPEGDSGCRGGNQDDAFWYAQTSGIQARATYPDTPRSRNDSVNGTCQFVESESVTTIDSWRNVHGFDEFALQQAVALVGPVVAVIDASSPLFQAYKGGIYAPLGCSSLRLNLAVLVVGYGISNDAPYWLVQNSWGTSWGMNGYMMIARDQNNKCGIASAASFPVIN